LMFVDPLLATNPTQWLIRRKSTWKASRLQPFWQSAYPGNQFPSFHHWLVHSKAKWRKSYSWHQREKTSLRQKAKQSVKLETHRHVFFKWLKTRKCLWKISRRKRQRRRIEEKATHHVTSKTTCTVSKISSAMPSNPLSSTTTTALDAILDEDELRRQALLSRPPLDISFLFNALICPSDDVVAHILTYLPTSEHGKLLCVSYTTSQLIQRRTDMWRILCPSHWILPSRPRKPWHLLYVSKLRKEELAKRQIANDVLGKAAEILNRGDILQKLKKLLKNANFDVNYVSGVVLERNSILNLAVIHKRRKITKWLVERMNADLESEDRGGFTPIINAAYAGDKYLVRYLMAKGVDCTKRGKSHYTMPLVRRDIAVEEFEGLTAEGWARRKGFNEIADLIGLGLS